MPAPPPPGTARDVILYRAHRRTPALEREVQRLQRELPDIDLAIVGYVGAAARGAIAEVAPSFLVDRPALEALPYPAKIAAIDWNAPALRGGPPNDLPVLAFYRRFPHYRHYWIIEYDVRYSGDWQALFSDLESSTADMLCTTLFDYDEYPQFYFWSTIRRTTNRIFETSLVRGFFPFARLTGVALAALDRGYAEGWTGHYEVIWPTICKLAGLTLEDIGNDGRYTPPLRRGKHYSCTPHSRTQFPGTFVYRPSFSSDEIDELAREMMPQAMLWHPVKER